MAVGLPAKTTYADGDVFSASDINDTNGTVNLVGQTTNFYAGKNRIINGDFSINQRRFTSNTANDAYNFDRFVQRNGGTTGTLTVTPQTFTTGSAPVAGYEATNFVQCVTASGASTNTYAILAQRIESVRTFAGETATVSFWARATSGTPKIGVEVEQSFGSGGSPSAEVQVAGGAVTLSTSWARYSVTVSIPSISGKTIGTNGNDNFAVFLWLSAGSTFASRASSIGLQNATFQVWGVQIEAGSTATAFETATGNPASELVACQRYYWRNSSSAAVPFASFGTGLTQSGTAVICSFINPVALRIPAYSIDFSGLFWNDGTNTSSITAMTINNGNSNTLITSTAATTTFGTQYRPVTIQPNNSSTAFIGFSAEL